MPAAAARPEIHIEVGDPRSPVLNGYVEALNRVDIIRGPLGSGKTTGTIVGKLMRAMMLQEPDPDGIRWTRIVAVRNTYTDLANTTIKDFRAGFAGMHTYKQGNIEPPTATVRFAMSDGTRVRSEVVFLALDRAEHVTKLRGVQCTWFWLNELKELVKPVVDMCDLRHGRYPSLAFQRVACTHRGMFGDSNSWDDQHWLYELSQDPPPGWKFWHQPGGVRRSTNEDGTKKVDQYGRQVWERNPEAENQAFLAQDPDYYVNGMAGKDEDWIAVNLGNEYGFVMEGKPVWTEYIDAKHCGDHVIPYDPELPLVLGVDFGRTPACAILQIEPVLQQFRVIDEFCATSMSAASYGPELYRYIVETYPLVRQTGIRGWGDPAGDREGQTIDVTPIQMLQAAGLPVNPSPVPNNNALIRRSSVSRALTRMCMNGQPALVISKKAKMIRRGAQGGFQYRRLQVAGAERYSDQPEKNMYSHPCEALEYALVGEGEGINNLYRDELPGEQRQDVADM